MKTIGIIDYYISEWHANKYTSILEKACEAVGEEFKFAYGYAELDVSLYDNLTTDEWCAQHGIERCDSIKELCEKSDYVMILAPSNPETHLRLASEALKYGKNTYIDKTFSPDYATAKEIFDIANKYGTKMFSSSALRYAEELKSFAGERELAITGGGGNLPEYIIHQAEMLITLVKESHTAISAVRNGDTYTLDVTFPTAHATMTYDKSFSYSVAANGGEPVVMKSSFFDALLADVLRFFLTGEPSFSGDETLAVAKLREDAIKCTEGL
ncbi:MAG: Gfo/Idh/MocA family oxidoreductase [Clostridia bacterium]|nr:Gfo/Idh/MocA family oxidoreductase [Clostridia bacterium]